MARIPSGPEESHVARQEHVDLPSPSPRVPSIAGEPAAEFFGTFILILFGSGVARWWAAPSAVALYTHGLQRYLPAAAPVAAA